MSQSDAPFLVPTLPQPLTVFCDGACWRTGQFAAAGYGVFVDNGEYKASICEPLAEAEQTAQGAEVKALNSALELVWAMRPRLALIVSDSEYAAKGYREWMQHWSENGWREATGEQVAYSWLWQEIFNYPKKFAVRKMSVVVQWSNKNSCPGMRRADQLARRACELNHKCELCKRFIGRKDCIHICRPVCMLCRGERFNDEKTYKQHVEKCHSATMFCRGCKMPFESFQARQSHEWMIHRNYVFRCQYCSTAFQSARAQRVHEEQDCEHIPYCGKCDKWFASSKERDQHFKDAHGSG